MENKEINRLKVGMWFITNTKYLSRVKSIDCRFPLLSEEKFPIIYSDDNKTCWSMDNIEQFGWSILIK